MAPICHPPTTRSNKSIGVRDEGFTATERQFVNSVHFEYVRAVEAQTPLVQALVAKRAVGGLFRTAVALISPRAFTENVAALQRQTLRKNACCTQPEVNCKWSWRSCW